MLSILRTIKGGLPLFGFQVVSCTLFKEEKDKTLQTQVGDDMECRDSISVLDIKIGPTMNQSLHHKSAFYKSQAVLVIGGPNQGSVARFILKVDVEFLGEAPLDLG